jgi:transcriptional regulator with XRE-family HTH domain
MQDSNAQRLADILRRRRSIMGFTIRELVRQSGVAQTTIARLEAGDTASPNPEHLGRLARALRVDIEELYEAAGYGVSRELPTLRPYLRTKYGLTETAARQVEGYLEGLTARDDEAIRKGVHREQSGDNAA